MRIATLVLLPVLTLGCGKAKSDTAVARGGGPVPVVTAVAEKRDVPVRLESVGTVEPFATVDVRPQVGGLLVEAGFAEGQEVRKGDLLFRIDDRLYVAARDQARGVLARDQAQATVAEQEAARVRGLARQQFASAQELERANATAAATKAAIQADEAALRSAELAVQWCTIRSPIDGRTGAIQVKPGNIVVANAGALTAAPLVTIHQIRPIRVSFPVPEAQLPQVRARMEKGGVEVEAVPQGDAGPAVKGPVTFLANQVDRATGTVTVKATFPNQDRRLWPGQFVRVSATVGRVEGAVVVPSPAVQDGQQGAYLFVVRADGAAELRKVKTGAAVDGWTVVEGIEAGERVVVDGQSRLAPGSPTKERAAAAPGGAK